MTKNDSEAVVNVNLARCDCGEKHLRYSGGEHRVTCPGKPVLVPLPLEPWRPVTMTVRLGECTCIPLRGPLAVGLNPWSCDPICPARPIKVTCSIRGKTWEESEVAEVDWQTRNERGDWNPSPMSHAERDAALAACRDRWALVQALVTGETPSDPFGRPVVIPPLYLQRNAVFAAICEMVRHENAAALAQERALKAMDVPWIDYGGCPGHHSIMDGRRPSVVLLARYVGKMIEEVCRHV